MNSSEVHNNQWTDKQSLQTQCTKVFVYFSLIACLSHVAFKTSQEFSVLAISDLETEWSASESSDECSKVRSVTDSWLLHM